MTPYLPELIRPLLDAYLTALDRELPGLVGGVYLHGSVALDAFQPGLSDVDFLTVVNRRPTDAEIDVLRSMHARLADTYPQSLLDGGYLGWDGLGSPADALRPYPYYHDGVLYPQGHTQNPVTWWLLKHRGLAVLGPQAHTLDFDLPWEHLAGWMVDNLNSYWRRFTTHPARMAWLMNDYGIQWAVLGVLRQHYTLRERDITSKIGAGEYGLTYMPGRWQPLIQEAIDIRVGKAPRRTGSRLGRAVEAVRFLRYAIEVGTALGRDRS